MPLTDFFQRNPSVDEIKDRLRVTLSALHEAKAGPNANSYPEQHRIASLSDDLCVLENRLESMQLNEDRAAQA